MQQLELIELVREIPIRVCRGLGRLLNKLGLLFSNIFVYLARAAVWVLLFFKNYKSKKLIILEEIRDILLRIEGELKPVLPAVMFELEVYKLTINGRIKGDTNMKLQLNENAEIKVKAIKDAAGNDAAIDGALSWAVGGDLALGDLEVSEDGMSAIFKRNGAVGLAIVQVSGDADLGEGVKLIVGEVELECMAGEAVVFELEANAVPQ